MKLSVQQVRKAICSAWSKETCWPKCWNSKNPAAGHCRVTALIVQKLLGGKIMFAEIQKKPKYTHFWNKLPSGQEVDFTKSQFPAETIIPSGKIISIKETMNSANIKKTYPILLERVRKNLK